MPPSISEPSADPVVSPNRRQWPADYYSSATPEPVLPRGVSYGCGALAVLVLLGVFIGGPIVARNLGTLVDLSMGPTLGEMRGMFTAEVTKEQKATLEKEIEAMRAQLRTNRGAVHVSQKFITTLEKAMKDDKLTPAEVEQLTIAARGAVTKIR